MQTKDSPITDGGREVEVDSPLAAADKQTMGPILRAKGDRNFLRVLRKESVKIRELP